MRSFSPLARCVALSFTAATFWACTPSIPPLIEHAHPDVDINALPIDAPAGSWTWVDFPGSRCMNGRSTGVGIAPSASSDRVLLFLEGGGACFDPITCTFGTTTDHYRQEDFEADLAGGKFDRGVFDRSDPDNPFRDFSYVYVPYCTGDVHAGDNPQGFDRGTGTGPAEHLGYENLSWFLKRLVPTFPSASMVVLTGISAGGVGAAYNYDRVQTAFGQIPVVLLDDSGIVLSDDYMKPCEQAQWRKEWNLAATLPPDCADCALPDGGGLINLARYLATKYPDRRMGMIASEQDQVFRVFLSYGYSPGCDELGDIPPDIFKAGVDELRDQVMAPYPNFKIYSVDSDQHVYLYDDPVGHTVSGGVKLTDWIRALIDGGPGFQTVRP